MKAVGAQFTRPDLNFVEKAGIRLAMAFSQQKRSR